MPAYTFPFFVTREVLVTGNFGRAVDQIKLPHLGDATTELLFWRWFGGADPHAAGLRQTVLMLCAMIGGLLLMRYLREVANAAMSVRMVYHIREAVYDTLQRVG